MKMAHGIGANRVAFRWVTAVGVAGACLVPNGASLAAPASETAAPASSTAPASGTSAPPASGTSAPPASGTTPPPSGTSPLPGAPPSAAEAQGMQASAEYNVKVRDLERKVNELKEQVFRSKARLNLLKETVLQGVIAGAHSAISFKNEMGGMYVPVRFVFALDGTEIFQRSDESASGKLGEQKDIEIYNGSITPGNHTLSVELTYQGNAYGVFAYLKGYKFVTTASHTFTATAGKQLQVKVVGFEKGNSVTTDPKDRPAVDFRETIQGEAAKKTDAPKDGAAPAPAPATK